MTKQSESLHAQVAQLKRDCRINFTGGDYAYLEEWLDAVAHQNSVESTYLYRQGYSDCIAVLKSLSVLE